MRVVPELDRAAPLKVCACQGTSESSSGELFMLGHAPCRFNLPCVKSTISVTPQVIGDPALDLWSAGVARRCKASRT